MDWRPHIAAQVRGVSQLDAPMAQRVSVRVGGAAELFVRPMDSDDLVRVLRLAAEARQPVTVLGGGANTLVGDGGIPGVTVKLPSGSGGLLTVDGDWVDVELSAGDPSGRLGQLAREHGLLGAEWSAGIPGTVGGMTAMNAGTRAGEMKDCVREVELCGVDGAEWVSPATLRFAYRYSDLGGRVVTRVRCRFRRGTPAEVAASQDAMEVDRTYRKRTQPLNLPNSGSVFRNPPGDFAARLIESVGLKGCREGGAQISEQHANFIVNRGGATARDVTTLMAKAQRSVGDRHQIPLALEVRLVGLFVPSPEVLGLVIDP